MCKPFAMDDFTLKAMKPYFRKEASVWDMVSHKGFSITEVAGDDCFDPDTRYGFLDRGGDTLVCTHVDTVCEPTMPVIRDNRVYSSAVDNRLGLYIALVLLERKGMVCDLLVTDHEEMGMSSAQFFVPPRKYNFAFGIDRKGDDAVLYQYDEEGGDFNTVLMDAGFSLGIGSYSDICDLSHLGCRCVNFGIGYGDNYHSDDAFADLRVTISQLNKVISFWSKYHGTHFAHDSHKDLSFEELLI